MYSVKINKLPKNTIEMLLKILWSDITLHYDKSFEVLRADLVVEGFRKGKAPKNIAQNKIRKEDVYDHFLRSYLPVAYEEILIKEGIKPIVSPKIEMVQAKENEDWEVKITTALKPTVVLGNYKEKIKEAKAELKKSDIWIPGKDGADNKDADEKNRKKEFQQTFDVLLKEAKVEISDIILDDEVSHRLTRLVDDITKLGLTLDNYLASKSLTAQKLKDQIRQEVEEVFKTEFILQEIAEVEKILVSKDELEQLFKGVEMEKDKKMFEANMSYYSTILKKQKTLDFLSNL